MPHAAPIHTNSPEYPPSHRNVYHDSSACGFRNDIKQEHRISGEGGRPPCDRCKTLAIQGR